MPRFFSKSIAKGKIELIGSESAHISKSLRLQSGDFVELFDGDGTVGNAVIETVGKNKIIVEVQQIKKGLPRRVGRIVIASSVAKADRFEWLVAKCTELGVDRIVPIIFDRTVKLGKGKNLNLRLNKIALESSKQCGRTFLPMIDEPIDLDCAAAKLKEQYSDAVFVFGSVGGKFESINAVRVDFDKSDVVVFIGPEGGFSDEELKFFSELGAIGIKLCDTVLRTETAGIAFASVLAAMRLGAP